MPKTKKKREIKKAEKQRRARERRNNIISLASA